MKNITVMEKRNIMTFSSIAIVIMFICLFAFIVYTSFTSSGGSNAAKDNVPKFFSNPSDVITVSPSFNPASLGYVSDDIIFPISLASGVKSKCSYDLFWIWDGGDTYRTTSSYISEFVVQMIDESGEISNTMNINTDSTNPEFALGNFDIVNDGGATVTDNLKLRLVFDIDPNYDQAQHRDKVYKGHFDTQNIKCSTED